MLEKAICSQTEAGIRGQDVFLKKCSLVKVKIAPLSEQNTWKPLVESVLEKTCFLNLRWGGIAGIFAGASGAFDLGGNSL